MDTLDQAGIPTTDVVFQGRGGSEKMKLVDVQALRSKCQGLTEGIHSVTKLVERQQRQEKYMNQSSSMPVGGLSISSSMPSFGFGERPASKESSLAARPDGVSRHRWNTQRRCPTAEGMARKRPYDT